VEVNTQWLLCADVVASVWLAKMNLMDMMVNVMDVDHVQVELAQVTK
jgi:hypothetical protein